MTFGCIQTARRYYRRIINGRQSVDGRPDSVQMMPPQMTTLQSDIIRSPPSPVTDVHDDFGRDSSFRSFFSSEIASSARLHLHNMPRKYGNFHPPEAVGFLRKVGRFLSSRRQYFYRLNGVVLSQHKTKVRNIIPRNCLLLFFETILPYINFPLITTSD